jgi:hypothetical protein
MTIYSYTPSFEQVNWHTFWLLKDANAALKEEVEALKAKLAGVKSASD